MSYMFVSIIHILACFFLVLVVLLQTGKGSDVGAVFGGSSQTIFGSSGAGNFLTKTTTGIAVLFMLTSLFLSYGATRRTTESLFDAVSTESPAVQEELPAATPDAEAAPDLSAHSPTDRSETATAGPEAPASTAPSAESSVADTSPAAPPSASSEEAADTPPAMP